MAELLTIDRSSFSRAWRGTIEVPPPPVAPDRFADVLFGVIDGMTDAYHPQTSERDAVVEYMRQIETTTLYAESVDEDACRVEVRFSERDGWGEWTRRDKR